MTSVQEVNPAVLRVRDPTCLQVLARHITDEITQGAKKTFMKVIDVSSNDPHRAGMSPISFVRQVLAACLYPKLLEDQSLPQDVRERAQKLLGGCLGGTIGSYSPTSTGLPLVLKTIAEFIKVRDGVGANPENIILSSGLEKILWMPLYLISSGEGCDRTGVLTPVPCPHTLPMLLDVTGLRTVPYQLMEDKGWALDPEELHQALTTGRGYCQPRAIYISNPGNPTGHVQDRKTIEEVIHFATMEGLILLVEEVYQDSVFGQDKEFISYRKVLFEMGEEYSNTVELISFNALSGARMGECGLRGGYMEVINFDPTVETYLKNLQATCTPPVPPQIALEVMVNNPVPGDPSYESYAKEILHIQMTFSQNARRACEFLNNLPGMRCQPAMAGGFLYPRLDLPSQMIKEAKMLGVEPDFLYCRRLLEEEGLCLGAGYENGQKDQNYHIRLSFLASADTMEEVLGRLRSFHLRLLEKFQTKM